MSQTQRVRVTRAFRHKGSDVGVGSIIDLDVPTASELRSGRKVEFVASDTRLNAVPFAKPEKAPHPEADKIAALSAQVAALTALVEKLSTKKEGAAKAA